MQGKKIAATGMMFAGTLMIVAGVISEEFNAPFVSCGVTFFAVSTIFFAQSKQA